MSAVVAYLARELDLAPPATDVLRQAIDVGDTDKFVAVLCSETSLSAPAARAMLAAAVAAGGMSSVAAAFAAESTLSPPATQSLSSATFDYTQPGATHYDGVSDYQDRNAPLAGSPPTAATKFVGSAWIALDRTFASAEFCIPLAMRFKAPDANTTKPTVYFGLGKPDAGPPVVIGKNVFQASTSYRSAGVTHSFPPAWELPVGFDDGEFHHYLWTIDSSGAGVGRFWYDGAEITGFDMSSVTQNMPAVLNLTQAAGLNVGALHLDYYIPLDLVVDKFPACHAEIFLDAVDALPDFGQVENLRKFITADLKPVYLGADGSRPFGTQPIFYSPLGGGVNVGYGGNLTPAGAPGVCASHP